MVTHVGKVANTAPDFYKCKPPAESPKDGVDSAYGGPKASVGERFSNGSLRWLNSKFYVIMMSRNWFGV